MPEEIGEGPDAAGLGAEVEVGVESTVSAGARDWGRGWGTCWFARASRGLLRRERERRDGYLGAETAGAGHRPKSELQIAKSLLQS